MPPPAERVRLEIRNNILELIGNTPLVRLNKVVPKGPTVAVKVEAFNPGHSVKDRIGLAMIEDAERKGKLKPGMTIVEPTSGNTGLGLAMAACIKGYKMVCTLPDKVPKEKLTLLKAFGAEVVVCPTDVEAGDSRSYYKVAEMWRDKKGAFLPYQYHNPANPEAHYKTTGPEIWRQTDGKITHWVAGVGTGGTISGAAKFLKEKNPDIRVIGIDTIGSVYTHWFKTREFPKDVHQYLIDGIGEDFMPSTVWWDHIDEVFPVTDKEAYQMTRRLAREEAIFTGSSGGAAVAGAAKVAAKAKKTDLIVTLLPDTGERYLSKLNDEWLKAHNLL